MLVRFAVAVPEMIGRLEERGDGSIRERDVGVLYGVRTVVGMVMRLFLFVWGVVAECV